MPPSSLIDTIEGYSSNLSWQTVQRMVGAAEVANEQHSNEMNAFAAAGENPTSLDKGKWLTLVATRGGNQAGQSAGTVAETNPTSDAAALRKISQVYSIDPYQAESDLEGWGKRVYETLEMQQQDRDIVKSFAALSVLQTRTAGCWAALSRAQARNTSPETDAPSRADQVEILRELTRDAQDLLQYVEASNWGLQQPASKMPFAAIVFKLQGLAALEDGLVSLSDFC